MLGEIAAELAHELGNVLQVVAGSLYVAKLEAKRGAAGASLPHIDKAERSSHLAQALVEDVMALARGEALGSDEVRVAEIVELARRDMAPGAARWVDAFDPDIRVRAHLRLFARLFHALYDNAVRASDPRVATVTTRAYVRDDATMLEVIDDGPGVPPEIGASLFEPLVKGTPGGSGLGLALARRVVEAHGGKIALAGGAGGGAVFRIELPRLA